MKKLLVGLASVVSAVSAWGQGSTFDFSDRVSVGGPFEEIVVRQEISVCAAAMNHPESFLVRQGIDGDVSIVTVFLVRDRGRLDNCDYQIISWFDGRYTRSTRCEFWAIR